MRCSACAALVVLAAALAAAPGEAATLRVFPLAGYGESGFSGDGGYASDARVNATGITALADGGFLLVDADSGRIRRIDAGGRIETVAGTGRPGRSADGLVARRARIRPAGRAVPLSGGGFAFAEPAYSRVRAVRADGRLTTLAGSGIPGYHGDGGPAAGAQLDGPFALAALTDGSLVVGAGHVVRRLTPGGPIATAAGWNRCGTEGDAGAVRMDPVAVAATAGGGILLADAGGCVRRLSADGTVTTVAGTGALADHGYTLEVDLPGDPRARELQLEPSAAIALPDGSLAVADGQVVRRVAPDGAVSTLAGCMLDCRSGSDAAPATRIQIGEVADLAALPDGTLAVALGSESRGLLLVGSDGLGSWLAGAAGDSVAALPDGSLLVASSTDGRVRRASRDGTVRIVAGGGLSAGGDGDPAAEVALGAPSALAAAPDGGFYVAERDHARVRRVDAAGRIWSFAGTGQKGTAGDGGPATQAQLAVPEGLALAEDGSLLIADNGWAAGSYATPDAAELGAGRIRRVAPDGTITTIAGSGRPAAIAGAAATSLAIDDVAGLRALPGGGFAVLYASDRTVGLADVVSAGTIGALRSARLCDSCSVRSAALSGAAPWLLLSVEDSAEARLVRLARGALRAVAAPSRDPGFFGSYDGALLGSIGADSLAALDALEGGGLALSGDGHVYLALPARSARLAVAIPREALRAVRDRRLVIRVTRPARASIELSSAAGVRAHRSLRLARGLNRVALPRVPSGEYVVTVTARSGRQFARDRQRLLLSRTLPLAVGRRLALGQSRGDMPARGADWVEEEVDVIRACRQMTPARVDCVFAWWIDAFPAGVRAAADSPPADVGCFVKALTLRPDGVVYTRKYSAPDRACVKVAGARKLFRIRPQKWLGAATEAPPL